MKLGPNQKKWINWLKRTKRPQTFGALYDGRGYCCLGIACVAMGMEPNDKAGYWRFSKSSGTLPPSIMRKLKLRTPGGGSKDYISTHKQLTSLNDKEHYSFKQIAKVLEENPEQYFTGPA